MCKIEKDILTVKEVSDYLQCSTKTVLNMLNSGKMKGFKVNGYSWRIKKSDILSYIFNMLGDNE